MTKRIKIRLELTAADKAVEIISRLSVLALWIITAASYSSLADIIPIHYNNTGLADRFGEKEYILILPIIATAFFAGLTILNKYPHLFCYPTKITKENALGQYTNITRIIRYTKLALILIFGLLLSKTILYAI